MKVKLPAKLLLMMLLSTGLLWQCGIGMKNNLIYLEEMSNWRTERLERLKSIEGWLNLAGLLWIENGVNSFGSDSSNKLIFPPGALAKAGTITLTDSILFIHFNTTEDVLVDDKPAGDCRLFTDANDHQTHVQIGRFMFTIIKRGTKFAVRLRDMESPLLGKLDSIPSFPVSGKYKVKAKLEPFVEPKSYEVNTVIGIPEIYKAPGKLVFKIQGKEFRIIPFDEGESYFIVFGDETSSIETYPAGRFLHAPKVDDSGNTILDFNKSTNPPCAFTPYATCPLPLKDNILDTRIEAGEKDVHLYNH